MMKALLLENIHPGAARILRDGGMEVIQEKGSLPEADLATALRGVSILGIRSRTQIPRSVFEQSRDLLAVGAFCIGTEQIDLQAASLHGVAVFNAPYSNTRSVAEMTIAEIVFLIRHLFDKAVNSHKGIWDKSAEHAREVRGKRLGIVGFGNIGSQVSTLAEAMGMDVCYYDVVDKLSIGNATRVRTLDELLTSADVVTIHVDGKLSNTNLIGARELALMKPGGILLNLSRGHVVDLEALAAAIRGGHIAGAAIDVFPAEPKSAHERLASPLQGLPNVLLTPHVAGSTEEAQENIAEFVSHKVLAFARTGNTSTSINFPRINVQRSDDSSAHRLLHVHANVPGVLSDINGILAKNNVNVLAQYLRTNEQIGYVIADVDREYRESLIEDLMQVPHTIRVRLL